MSTFKKMLSLAIVFLILFAAFTLMVMKYDVQAIGPEGSSIGFATINGAVDSMILRMDIFDKITDAIRLVCYAVCVLFAALGIYQFIKRKNVLKVDAEIIAMGVNYVVLFATYFLFEIVTINFRPILEDGELKASYPSSHLLAAIVILTTACMVLAKKKLFTKVARIIIYSIAGVMCVVTAAGRLICKAHWFTDIFAAIILSGFFVFAYLAVITLIYEKKEQKNKKYRSNI